VNEDGLSYRGWGLCTKVGCMNEGWLCVNEDVVCERRGGGGMLWKVGMCTKIGFDL
jgi:hypothetical protein